MSVTPDLPLSACNQLIWLAGHHPHFIPQLHSSFSPVFLLFLIVLFSHVFTSLSFSFALSPLSFGLSSLLYPSSPSPFSDICKRLGENLNMCALLEMTPTVYQSC